MARPNLKKTKTPNISKDDKGRYWIRGRILGKRMERLAGSTLTEAKKVLFELTEQRARELKDETASKKPDKAWSLGELCERYRKEDEAVNKTWKKHRAEEKAWLDAWGASFPLDLIDNHKVTEQQHLWLSEGLSPGSVNRLCSRLRRVLQQATRDGLLKYNPLQSMPRLKEPPGRSRVLGQDEERRLEAVMPRWAWRYVAFAFLSGIRQEKQFTMKVYHVNLEKNLLEVVRAKGEKSRFVPIPNQLRVIVVELLAVAKELGSEWLFPNRSGTNHDMSSNFIRRWFKPALKKAGIKGFTWHDLRRTYGSRLGEMGARTRSVQKLLGHSNIKTTERYMQVSDDHLQEVVDLMNSQDEGSC